MTEASLFDALEPEAAAAEPVKTKPAWVQAIIAKDQESARAILQVEQKATAGEIQRAYWERCAECEKRGDEAKKRKVHAAYNSLRKGTE